MSQFVLFGEFFSIFVRIFYNKKDESMRKNLILFVLLSSFVLFMSACNGKKKESNEGKEAVNINSIEALDNLQVDTKASYIDWVGSKPGTDHTGKIYLQSGVIGVDKAQKEVLSGKFVIDMNSIDNEDLEGEMKAKLEGHLKSADFFDVEKYPTSTFEIAEVTPVEGELNNYMVTGNLTMKDVTLSISFKAMIKEADGVYTAVSEPIVLDRTQWGVNYGSKNIFKDLKDNIISDQIQMTVHLEAK